MGLTKQDVRKVIAVYMKAWREQDPDLIVTIFDQDATYHERVMEDITIAGRDAIRDYWKSKVVGAQANIICGLLHTYLDHDTDTAICEWVAEFDDVAQGVRKRMKEIAVLEFRRAHLQPAGVLGVNGRACAGGGRCDDVAQVQQKPGAAERPAQAGSISEIADAPVNAHRKACAGRARVRHARTEGCAWPAIRQLMSAVAGTSPDRSSFSASRAAMLTGWGSVLYARTAGSRSHARRSPRCATCGCATARSATEETGVRPGTCAQRCSARRSPRGAWGRTSARASPRQTSSSCSASPRWPRTSSTAARP